MYRHRHSRRGVGSDMWAYDTRLRTGMTKNKPMPITSSILEIRLLFDILLKFKTVCV